jgi:hypothetical protein
MEAMDKQVWYLPELIEIIIIISFFTNVLHRPQPNEGAGRKFLMQRVTNARPS